MNNKLQPGERLWNGAVISAPLAEVYNSISERIESFVSQGLEPPEYLLNGRHNLIADTLKGEL